MKDILPNIYPRPLFHRRSVSTKSEQGIEKGLKYITDLTKALWVIKGMHNNPELRFQKE